MREELIIAGFGGQGIMFTGMLLAQAAMLEGKQVTFFPSYGAEVRGGTANCSVIVSDSPIGSPVIAHPDSLVVLNKPSLERFGSRLKAGGTLLLNSTLIEGGEEKETGTVIRIPASRLAEELGQIRVANIVSLGKYLSLKPVVMQESVFQALAILLTGRKKDLMEINRRAFRTGYQYNY